MSKTVKEMTQLEFNFIYKTKHAFRLGETLVAKNNVPWTYDATCPGTTVRLESLERDNAAWVSIQASPSKAAPIGNWYRVNLKYFRRAEKKAA